jgi:hypothetical protein
MNNLSQPHLFGMLAGLFLATGLVLSSMLATTTWLKLRNLHAVQTSWEGMNDTSSPEKTITAVVSARFALK